MDWTAGTVRLEVGATKNDEGGTFRFDVLPELRQVLEEQRDEAARLKRKGVLCLSVSETVGVRPVTSS